MIKPELLAPAKDLKKAKFAIDYGADAVYIGGKMFSLRSRASNFELEDIKEIVEYAHERGVSVEAEVGHIGGTEDNITSSATNATLEDCITLYENTGIDSLAPALGSVHGFYKGEPNLDFETMKIINENLPIPLVLHGGTGIPEEKIKKAISCGISKININTDLQSVWSKAVRKFLEENKEVYDPRKIIGSGESAIKTRIEEIVTLFGTKR